jgi:hypothetical protein
MSNERKLVGSPCPAPVGMMAAYWEDAPGPDGSYAGLEPVVCLCRAVFYFNGRPSHSEVVGLVQGESGLEPAGDCSNFIGYVLNKEQLELVSLEAKRQAKRRASQLAKGSAQ